MTGTYANITGMNKNLAVAGTSSVILFIANITIGSGSDAETDVALFVDGVEKCEGRCFNDADTDELGCVCLAWWQTGLSTANHDFDVRAREGGQAGGEVSTAELRSSQVIEFTGTDAPTILSEVRGISSTQAGTASYVDIPSMKVTPSITGGATSLIIVSGTVNFASSGDTSGFLGLEIESVIEAEGQVYNDSSNEAQSVSYMFAKKAMTAGTRDFTFQMKNGQGTVNLDADVDRHMQVVEFTNTPNLDAVDSNTTADATPTSSFTQINDMLVAVTPDSTDSFFLVTSSVTWDSDSGDSNGIASIRIDGTDRAIASSGIDDLTQEPGHVGLNIMITGLSTSSKNFQLMFKEGTQTGMIIAPDTEKHIQVIEFLADVGLKKIAPVAVVNIADATIKVIGLIKNSSREKFT